MLYHKNLVLFLVLLISATSCKPATLSEKEQRPTEKELTTVPFEKLVGKYNYLWNTKYKDKFSDSEDESAKQLINSKIPDFLEVPVDCSVKGIKTGLIMPREINDWLTVYSILDKDTLLEEFRYTKPHFQSMEQLFEFMVIHHRMKALHSNEKVAEWLSKRADTLPPTKFDIFIAWDLAVDPSTPVWHNNDKISWEKSKQHWLKMLNGKNPLYRYIALLRVHCFLNYDERLKAYEKALTEKSSLLRVVALDGLVHSKESDVKRILKNFIAKCKDNPSLGKGDASSKSSPLAGAKHYLNFLNGIEEQSGGRK